MVDYVTWDLFGREKREAAARNEARATMAALDTTVNGEEPAPEKPKPTWQLDLKCHSCKGLTFAQDPAAKTRWICSGCQGVLNITIEVQPKFRR